MALYELQMYNGSLNNTASLNAGLYYREFLSSVLKACQSNNNISPVLMH